MRIRNIAAGILSLNLMMAQGYAEEPITGAFGITLGDTFDPASSPYSLVEYGGETGYIFNPSQPYEKFDTYFVVVTPITNIIYGIGAMGEITKGQCTSDMNVLISILSKKYGDFKDPDTLSLDPTKNIQKGAKFIYVKCHFGIDDHKLEINYKDVAIAKQAEKERIEIESQKVNSDGL